ncbi:MAG: LysE family translocator [Candidatus Rokubacteria bacterium]|nr:LysE family translocator [Candidatus Rokubacteria bacterium]
MPDLATLVLFCAATVALLVVPGPAVIYIVTRSIHQGRAAGVASVLGIHVGTLCHIAAATLGLSALLASSALAYGTVRYLGAAYLIYLGVRTLFARPAEERRTPSRPERLPRIFADGVVVNVLNPKTALFFFAFLPQFVDPARGAVSLQIAILGAVFVLLGLLSDGAYALLAARGGDWLKANLGFARIQRLISGSIYFTLGAAAALSGARSTHK